MMSNNVEARLDVIAHVEQQLIEIVQDDSREAKAIEVIEQMKVTVKKQHDDYSTIQSDFLKVSDDYNAGMQQYNQLDEKADVFWRATMKQQVDLRYALREQLTRDEWKKLYKKIK